MSESSPRVILHTTDFSEASRPALGLARDLARDHDATLFVVHIVDSAMGRSEVGVIGSTLDQVRSRVEQLVASLQRGDSALKVQGRVEEGLPTDAILDLAKELRADLIVMGSHGRTGVGRVLVGSVAERVARSAPCPVLLLKAARDDEATPGEAGPAPSGPRFPVVVVPTDFSRRSREALKVASWLVQEGSLVVAVHVVEAVHVAAEGYAEALLERLKEWVAPITGLHADHQIREGDTADEILAVADQTHANLIVVPSHGRTGLDRLVMGSVAEQVFRGATCPVLIVRIPDEARS